jgi:transcriptional regulator GlxA family with amidase domain
MRNSTPDHVREVAMVGFEGIQVLDVTGPLEVFSRAGRLLVEQRRTRQAPYRVSLVAGEGGPLGCSSGMALVAERSWRDLGPVDTLLVSGGVGVTEALRDEALLAWLAVRAPQARRYGAVCTGALLLGRAGLLAGRRVTTHWASVRPLAELVPTARIEPDAIFVRDGRLWTSAGVTAGMDMALAMVEEDWGRRLALEVARDLVMYLKRAGGQPQRSAYLESQMLAGGGQLRRIALWIVENLAEDLSVVSLAQRTGMSPRHFSRCFQAELGSTPAKFVERARFEAARQRVEEGQECLESIAFQCGFGTVETLRRVFVRRTGLAPNAYRLRARRGIVRDLPGIPGGW